MTEKIVMNLSSDYGGLILMALEEEGSKFYDVDGYPVKDGFAGLDLGEIDSKIFVWRDNKEVYVGSHYSIFSLSQENKHYNSIRGLFKLINPKPLYF